MYTRVYAIYILVFKTNTPHKLFSQESYNIHTCGYTLCLSVYLLLKADILCYFYDYMPAYFFHRLCSDHTFYDEIFSYSYVLLPSKALSTFSDTTCINLCQHMVVSSEKEIEYKHIIQKNINLHYNSLRV